MADPITITKGVGTLLSLANSYFGDEGDQAIGGSAEYAQFQEDLELKRAELQQEEQAKTMVVGLGALSLVGFIIIVATGGD